MLHKTITLLVISCCPTFIYAQMYFQKPYKSQVLRNGFEEGKLVRNHTTLFYYHADKKLADKTRLTDGIITVDRVVEYAVDESFNSCTTYIHKDTLLTFRGVTTKNKKDGTFLSLPPDNIFYLHTYQNNELNGEFKGFYNTGQLQCEGYYQDGKQTGAYSQYYANGKLAIQQQFADAITGLSHIICYYTDGLIESKGSYYNDKKVNEWYYYDKQGNLIKTEYYTNKGRLLKVK